MNKERGTHSAALGFAIMIRRQSSRVFVGSWVDGAGLAANNFSAARVRETREEGGGDESRTEWWFAQGSLMEKT